MKKIILALSVLVASQSVFARHAYGNDNCIAKTITGQTLEIDLINGQPANPHYIVNSSRKDGEEFQFVEFRGANFGLDEKGGDLVLQSKGDKNKVTQKISDDCFEGEQSSLSRSAQIVSLSKDVARAYGIKKGQTLHFSCYQYYTAPTGKKCD